MALRKLGKLARDALFGDDVVEPYKCKICRMWVKRKSKAKLVCPKCYEGLE